MLALAALMLAACARQPRDDVQVGVGVQMTERAKAKDYAALYAPYAMMATVAYTDKPDLDSRFCPDPARLAMRREGESAGDAAYRASARGWIGDLNRRGWQCYSGVVGSLPCPAKLGSECKPVGGLEFHVWRRIAGGQCREVAIAFRGTDKNDVGDWVSNFRWLNRLVPKFDQYAQVQDHITPLVGRLKRDCGAGALFVSAGHSLGGGLAQQAAYADSNRGIRYVYAFDPSPVTGFFDVSDILRAHSTKGLGVDRAFEAGEILVLPRMIIENFFPPLACNPRMRTVRFNVLTGLPASQHSIGELTKQLNLMAHEPGANPAKVTDYQQASNCIGVPLTIPPPA